MKGYLVIISLSYFFSFRGLEGLSQGKTPTSRDSRVTRSLGHHEGKRTTSYYCRQCRFYLQSFATFFSKKNKLSINF